MSEDWATKLSVYYISNQVRSCSMERGSEETGNEMKNV